VAAAKPTQNLKYNFPISFGKFITPQKPIHKKNWPDNRYLHTIRELFGMDTVASAMIAVSTKLLIRLIPLLAAGAMAYPQTLPWPLKTDIDLSSGYGDYRSGGRFHAGLDLRTGGQIGEKVYSPVDGYVWRIRMSYGGYGKGLYLKGRDGHIYVFGHLSRFNEPLQSTVIREQFRQERYSVDLQLPADSIPVKLGQLLAFSGQTGAGGPHLHIEERTQDNVPLNPLNHGFRLEDNIPPTFERLGVHLLDDRSLFADGHRKMYLPVSKVGTGKYQVTGSITLNAPFGLQAGCADQMRAGGRKQAVFKLSLHIDDSLYYESTLDSLPYEIGSVVDLVYDRTEAANGDQRVRRTYRPVAPNQVWDQALASYGGEVSGRCAYGLDAPPVIGEHRAEITAEDVFGNRSVLVFRFNYVEAGASRSLTHQCDYAAYDDSSENNISDWRLEEDGLVIREKTGKNSRYYFFRPQPPAQAYQGDAGRLLRRHIAGLTEQGIDLQAVGWGRGRHISVDSGAFTLILPPGVFFDPQFVAVSTVAVQGGPGAPLASKAYRVQPEAVAMREKFRLSVKLPAGGPRVGKAGLCCYDQETRVWEWIGDDSGDSDLVSGSSSGGGVFAALIDTTPPTITGLNLRPGHKYPDRKPEVKFRLRDNLSSFNDTGSIDVRIDGRWLLPEFDMEEGRVVATLREPLDFGPHELKITAKDRAGNRSEKTIAFEIVRQKKK